MTTIVVIMEGFLCTKCGSSPKGPGTLQKVLESIIIFWETDRLTWWANAEREQVIMMISNANAWGREEGQRESRVWRICSEGRIGLFLSECDLLVVNIKMGTLQNTYSEDSGA